MVNLDFEEGNKMQIVYDDVDVVVINSELFKEQDYVLVRYDDQFYPGQIIQILDTQFRVRCMEKSGTNWKWPHSFDELWYLKDNIIKKISLESIVPVSNRGVFKINDELLSATIIH